MKSVVLYARSATSRSDVDRQFQLMQEFLDHGANVAGCYSDVGSGMDPQRPGLQEALQQILNGEVDVLMVTSLDRLTRSVQDLARLTSIFTVTLEEPVDLP